MDSYVWLPLEDGERVQCTCGDPRCDSYVSPDGGILYMRTVGHGSVYLPDDKRLCRLTPAPKPPAMPEPDWSQAPEWARWWAVDATGVAYWHEDAPYLDHAGAMWLNRQMDWAHDEQRFADEIEIPLGLDWRTLCRQRPQPGQEVDNDRV